MSHFSVAVFSRTPGDVEALLAPFNEQVAPGDPYAVFVRDESGQLDEKGQAKGWGWHNPNARWDWWVIGGRWRGLLLLRPGKKRLYRAVGTLATRISSIRPIAATRRWSRTAIFRRTRRRSGVRHVCGKSSWKGMNPARTRILLKLWEPGYYLERYGDKETFIRRKTAFNTYAFVTAEGRMA